MKKFRFLLTVMLVTLVAFGSSAQEVIKPPKYPDGVYTKENTRTRRAIPYAPLREADVMWSKRVWRVIDLREKINVLMPARVQSTIVSRSRARARGGRGAGLGANSGRSPGVRRWTTWS